MVTLDTTILGWRARDLGLAHLPFLKGQGIAQYVSDPVFRKMLPEPPEKNLAAAAFLFTQIYSDPSLTWDKLKTLRRITRLPILLKGVQHPDDAALAVSHGFDGIIVSNHGGRQVDGAVGSADQLPLCAERVQRPHPRALRQRRSARARTPSRRWRWAPTPSASAGPTPMRWPPPARRASKP